MLVRMIAALIVALTLATAVAAPNPPSPILKLAQAVVNASNTDNASGLRGLYANDAIVVDEIPPFVWRGASAGVAWWSAVEAFTQKKRERIRLGDVRIGEFQHSATDAYLIQAMTITEVAGDRSSTESGTLTYTLHKMGGRWLISSQVWTTKP